MAEPQNQFAHHLGFTDLLKLSVRVFRTRSMRTFLTILGISFGIGTVLALVSLGYGLQSVLIGRLVANEESLITLEAFLPSESELNITTDNLNEIAKINQVSEISPLAEFPGEIKFNNLRGFVLVRMAKPNFFRLSGVNPDIGSPFKDEEKALVISSEALKLIGLSLNEEITNKKLSVKTFYPKDDIESKEIIIADPVPIKGVVVDELQPPFILVPIDLFPEKPPFYKETFIKAAGLDAVEPVRDKLIEKNYMISAKIDLVKQARQIMNIITIVLGTFGVTALVVSAIGMFNTMVIGFLERIFEVGIMKAIGGTDADIRNLFLMESFIMGLAGGIGGIIIGVGAGKTFNYGLSLLARYLGGKPLEIFITPTWFVALIIAISATIGLMSGFWPARRAATLSPKQAFLKK